MSAPSVEEYQANFALEVIFSFAFFSVSLVSAVIIALRKKIYPNGWYPKITVKMYMFTFAHGLVKGITIVIQHFTFIKHNWQDSTIFRVVSMVDMCSYFIFYCMIWYYLMTWALLVYIPRSPSKTKSMVRHWQFVICVGISLCFMSVKIASVAVGSGKWTETAKILASLHYMLVSLSYVLLSILYIIYRRNVVALIHGSQLASAEKVHRVTKLTHLLIVLLVCLNSGLVFAIYITVYYLEPATFWYNYTFALITIEAPLLAADIAMLIYFSPIMIYKGGRRVRELGVLYRDSTHEAPSSSC